MATPALRKVLITGAGTGFGHEAAMRLAEKGFDVIAAVEIYAQVQTMKRQAKERGVTLQVEKLDVTNDGDRRKALDWGVEILVNNAGVGEGGSTVDIPASNIRHQFEVNVTGPLLLTQPIAKQMIKRGAGRIVWVSSREGLNVNPFTGIYSASKHAVEAIAETMADELQEYNIEVATVNPGPFLTGFNDRMFQTWESWEDDPSQRLFDYAQARLPARAVRPRAGLRDADGRRGRRGRQLPQSGAQVDDRRDRAPPADSLAAQGHRRSRDPASGDHALLRDAAGDSRRELTVRTSLATRRPLSEVTPTGADGHPSSAASARPCADSVFPRASRRGNAASR